MTATEALSAAIRAALIAGDPVRLPGLGTLENVHVPARVVPRPEGGRALLPPSAAIRFRPSDEPGAAEPALVALFARFARPEGDPQRAFAAATDQVLARLAARGEVDLEDVGRFRRDDRAVGFAPAGVLAQAVNRAYAGLAPVAAPAAPAAEPASPSGRPEETASPQPSDVSPGDDVPGERADAEYDDAEYDDALRVPFALPPDPSLPAGGAAAPEADERASKPRDAGGAEKTPDNTGPDTRHPSVTPEHDSPPTGAETPLASFSLDELAFDAPEADAPEDWLTFGTSGAEAPTATPGEGTTGAHSGEASPEANLPHAQRREASSPEPRDAAPESEPSIGLSADAADPDEQAWPLDYTAIADEDAEDLLLDDVRIAPPLLNDWDEPATLPSWAAGPDAAPDEPPPAPEHEPFAADAPQPARPEPPAEDTDALFSWPGDDLPWPNESAPPDDAFPTGDPLAGDPLTDDTRPEPTDKAAAWPSEDAWPGDDPSPRETAGTTGQESLLPDDVEAWLAGTWVPPHADAVSADLGPPPASEEADYQVVDHPSEQYPAYDNPARGGTAAANEPDRSGFAASPATSLAAQPAARRRRTGRALAIAAAGACVLAAILLLPRLLAPRDRVPVPPREAAPEAAATAPPDFQALAEEALPAGQAADTDATAPETPAETSPETSPEGVPGPTPAAATRPEAPPVTPRPAPAPPAATQADPAAAALTGAAPLDPAQGGFTWITDSTPIRADAERLATRYRQAGFRVAVLPGTAGDRTVYRVAVGQFASREAAIAARNRLPADVRQDAWTLNLSP